VRSGFAQVKGQDLEQKQDVSTWLSFVERFAGALKEKSLLPSQAYVHVDSPQNTEVEKGHSVRNLLPHFDSAHCSYLTPSLIDYPTWNTNLRLFRGHGYTATSKTRLLQALVVINRGASNASTGLYPWLDIVEHAARRKLAHNPNPRSTARFLGDNIAIAHQHGDQVSNYISIPSFLGATEREFRIRTPHCAETKLDFPYVATESDEDEVCNGFDCGVCRTDSGAFFCHGLQAALGMNLHTFRTRYERQVLSESGDLLIFNNLALLHAGWYGANDRVIQPISVVVDNAKGPDYETWLFNLWRWRIQH